MFRLPLYLSVKGELIDSGLGFLEVPHSCRCLPSWTPEFIIMVIMV